MTPARPIREDRYHCDEDQHEQRPSGDPDQPVEPGGEPVDRVMPRLGDTGTRWGGVGTGWPCWKRDCQGGVGGLAVEEIELTLELLDLALDGVDWFCTERMSPIDDALDRMVRYCCGSPGGQRYGPGG